MDLFNYQISVHAVERRVKQQFSEPDERRREPDAPEPERTSRMLRLRLATGNALHALANVIDPGTPVPSRAR